MLLGLEASKGLAVGANAYVTKPFSTQDLLGQIRAQLDDG
jgi:DNA-binding response OmpR family regulator